jgi:hypothetical protein
MIILQLLCIVIYKINLLMNKDFKSFKFIINVIDIDIDIGFFFEIF